MTSQTQLDTEVEMITVGAFAENTFFLRKRDEKEVLIIDPGDESARIIQLIEDRGWNPVAVVNTHGHIDHICAVQDLKEKYGIEFYLHSDDLPLVKEAPLHASLFGLAPPRVPEMDHDLAGLSTLSLAGMTMELRHTPGHSPGSVTFVLPGRVISGDVLFQSSIGRTDLPGGDFDILMNAIRTQLLPLPDETIVHCGHGPETTIGEERRSNPFITGEAGPG